MTMPDSNIKQYQALAFHELSNIIKRQKIPNALIFFGNENTKRKEAALFLGKGCNCVEQSGIACNKCKSCRKIDSNSHPDILYIDLEKEKKIISIAQIRKMGLKISSRPNEAKFRMVLILNADKMNIQAQNALLKMLEEPPAKTFFVLLAQKTRSFLPTIISRCRKIRFIPLSHKHVEQSLVNDFKIDNQMAYIAAKTSNADFKKAKMYLNLNYEENFDKKKLKKIDWIKKREYLILTLTDIILANKNKSIAKGLMLSQKISLDTNSFDDTITIMLTFFRDLMILGYNGYEQTSVITAACSLQGIQSNKNIFAGDFDNIKNQLVNLDFSDTLKKISHMGKSCMFAGWLEKLFEAQKKIASNSTPRLALDSFFLKIAADKGKLLL